MHWWGIPYKKKRMEKIRWNSNAEVCDSVFYHFNIFNFSETEQQPFSFPPSSFRKKWCSTVTRSTVCELGRLAGPQGDCTGLHSPSPENVTPEGFHSRATWPASIKLRRKNRPGFVCPWMAISHCPEAFNNAMHPTQYFALWWRVLSFTHSPWARHTDT